MKKYGILICALALVLLLCSCDAMGNPGGLIGDLVNPAQDPTDPFAQQAYYLIYTSNGDGTCYVSDILIDPIMGGGTVEIPNKSPAGDRVIGLRVELLPETHNDAFPLLLTEQTMEQLKNEMAEVAGDFNVMKFTAYYRELSVTPEDSGLVESECPLAAYTKMYLFSGTSESDYEQASRLFLTTLPMLEKDKSVYDAQVLELCKQHLTDEQTERMLKLLCSRCVSGLSEIVLHKDIEYVSIMQYGSPTVPVNVWLNVDMTKAEWAEVDCPQTNLHVVCTDGEIVP